MAVEPKKVGKPSKPSRPPTKKAGGSKRKLNHQVDHHQDRSYFATRLCVRNLPKDVTEGDLRSFLLSGIVHAGVDVHVTDCRVLPKGKESIAFVGVSSPEGADLILERRNQTYLRTRRIVVERAYKRRRDDDEEKPPPASADPEGGRDTGSRSKVRQGREGLSSSSSSNVLLAAATAAAAVGKNKFWANDAEAAVAEPPTPPKAGPNNDDSRSAENIPRDPEDSATGDDDDDDDDDASSVDDADALLPSRLHPSGKASDMDFLKSIRRRADDLEQQEEGLNREESEDESENESSEHEDDASDLQHNSGHGDNNSRLDAEPPPETHDPPAPSAQSSNRIFVRNLPFSTTEEDLSAYFGSVAGCTVVECHVPVTDQKRSKGFAFVTLSRPREVAAAIAQLDGCDFQGRILHLMPAHPKPNDDEGGGGGGGGDHAPSSFKDRRNDERRSQAGANSSSGLASYVRTDAVVDSLASRMGFQKGDILSLKDGLSSGDAAIRLALGETAVIEENQKFLERLGISLSSLDARTKRSNTCILVKNLPADTAQDELMKVFGSASALSEGSSALSEGSSTHPCRLELAPSRTLAVVEYSHRNDAKSAFRRLAYRRFKNVPLYLDWAPVTAEKPMNDGQETSQSTLVAHATHSQGEVADELMSGPTSTVHVKNLSFATTEERLWEFFATHVPDVRSVRIPQKVVPSKKIGGMGKIEVVRSLSLGYGFVEFASQDSCRKVIKSLQGAILDGHTLEITQSSAKRSSSTSLTASTSKPKQPTKLVVRNVPFQATRKELLVLFGSFGQLKKVRLPKKFDGSHRGFAFVEFLTSNDALTAFKALSSTHLYGRHLVIEWANEEGTDDATMDAPA